MSKLDLIVKKTNSTTDILNKRYKSLKEYEKAYDSEYLELYLKVMESTKDIYKNSKKVIFSVFKIAYKPVFKGKKGFISAFNKLIDDWIEYQRSINDTKKEIRKILSIAKKKKQITSNRIKKPKLKKFDIKKSKSTISMINTIFGHLIVVAEKKDIKEKNITYLKIMREISILYVPLRDYYFSIANVIKIVNHYAIKQRPKDKEQFIQVVEQILSALNKVDKYSLEFIGQLRNIIKNIEKMD